MNLLIRITFLLFLFQNFSIFGQLPGRSRGTLGGSNSGSFGNNPNQNTGATQSTDPNNPAETPKKGKLLDDSTKQIYGPKSVRYFLETDIANNRKTLYEIDTLIDKIHQFNFLQQSKNYYQDLGNMGTASRSVFFKPVNQLGKMLGYNAFDLYYQPSNSIKYYDTKSPYTDMRYATGGNGDQILKFDFTRNIKPNWNAGLHLQTFVGSKQYANATGRGQNSIRNWNVIFQNSYFSKDSNYTLLANFNYFDHSSADDGGVKILDSGTAGGLTSEDPFLTTANTQQKRKQIHLYHQYKLANGFQLYHVLDVTRQNNSFIDESYTTGFDNKIYKTVTALGYVDSEGSDSLFRKYRLIENNIGVKGFVKGFNYRAHFRRRDYKLTDSLDATYLTKSLINRSENFVGGWLNYYFKDSTKAFVETEYLLAKDFNLRFEYDRKLLKIGFYNVLSSPSLIHEKFQSDLAAWQTDFKNQFSNTFYGTINYRVKNVLLRPSLEYSLIKNYIYFDTLAQPKQTSDLITILKVGTELNIKRKKFEFDNEIYFNAKTGPDLIRIPTLFINSRVVYDFKYAKILDLKLGLELHYKSAYYADAYMPVIQQFYLQDQLKIAQGLMADVFLNMKLNRVRLMVKYAQLNNIILGDYFVGPNFKGLKGGVSFGVNWPLFD